jgi:hypothetical protein
MERPVPSARNALFVDAPGVGLGSDHEDEIDGVSFKTVGRLEINFASGAPLIAATHRAPAATRRHHAYLRDLRFFVIFYPGHRGIPKTVCALSAAGHRSHCQRVWGG